MFSKDDMPLGFVNMMAQNEHALFTYASLSQDQRQALINQAKKAGSKQQMRSLVNSLAGDEALKNKF